LTFLSTYDKILMTKYGGDEVKHQVYENLILSVLPASLSGISHDFDYQGRSLPICS